jgi:hypothetical protein
LADKGDWARTGDVQLGNSFLAIGNKGFIGFSLGKTGYNLVKNWQKRNPRATNSE